MIFLKSNINICIFNKIFYKTHTQIIFGFIIANYKEEKLYHCGGSFKDGGNSISTIDKIEEIELYKPSIDIVINNDELIFQ